MRHILIVGSGTFAARLAPAFSPRRAFDIKRVSSISTDLILAGWVPELAVLDGDSLRHEIFLLLDALSRFEAAVPAVVISSDPEFFNLATAMEAVSPAQARALLSRRGQQLRKLERSGDVARGHVPLGITSDYVAIGSHVAFVWRNDADLRRLFRFWALSEPTAKLVLAAPSQLLDYLCGLLPKFGIEVPALLDCNQLILVEGERLTNIVTKKIASIVSRAALQGASSVRVIAFCAGHKGDRHSKRPEETLDKLLANLPSVLVCPYRIGEFRADDFLMGALATHRQVVIGDRLFNNSFYLPER